MSGQTGRMLVRSMSSDSSDDDLDFTARQSQRVAGNPSGPIAPSALLGQDDEESYDEPEVGHLTDEAASSTKQSQQDSQTVFEIRDFTTASSFERIAHQISLKAKLWSNVLREGSSGTEDLCLRESFQHLEFVYDLVFQLIRPELHQYSSLDPALFDKIKPAGSPGDKIGMHTFPMKGHRLQRWYGLHHFVIASARGRSIDVDTARTVLSAAVVAVRGITPALQPALGCFVPVDTGKRRRYIGELSSGCSRAIFNVDQKGSVPDGFQDLDGLRNFFCKKFAVTEHEVDKNLVVGARFTYLADAFDPFDEAVPAAVGAGLMAEKKASCREDKADTLPNSGLDDAINNANSGVAGVEPICGLQLHCFWPSFRGNSFVDRLDYSELDPRLAPFWKVRLLRETTMWLPVSDNLQALLRNRNEAASVKSAAASMQTYVPKSTFDSFAYAIQESIEQVLLPSEQGLQQMVDQCLARPLSVDGPGSSPDPARTGRRRTSSTSASGRLAELRGARCGTLFAKFAEISGELKCFKAAVMLWMRILAHLRKCWDNGDSSSIVCSKPVTQRCGARGVRSEHFSSGNCVAQQKFEMLMKSFEARFSRSDQNLRASDENCICDLKLEASGKPLVPPMLVHPALVTLDMMVQLDTAAASMSDDAERAELHGRELRSDMAAFKAANADGNFADFMAWRSTVLGLSFEQFPHEWLEHLWVQAVAKPASEQTAALFDPMREAEMALHYLENMDGTQLLLQVVRTRFSTALEIFGQEAESPHLRVLRDRAISVCCRAFGQGWVSFAGDSVDGEDASSDSAEDAMAVAVGEVDDFPSEAALQAALSAVDVFEKAVRLSRSLRAKFCGLGDALVEDLLSEGEAAVTTEDQRRVLEEIINRSRIIAQLEGRERPDGLSAFDALPLAKEFVLVMQPSFGSGPAAEAASIAATRRLYVEIRERHLRLATGRGFRLI